MTKFASSRPRLYDELNSSHLTIHGASAQAVAAALVTINGHLYSLVPTVTG